MYQSSFAACALMNIKEMKQIFVVFAKSKIRIFTVRKVCKCVLITKYLHICISPPHSSHESPELPAYNTWQNCDPNK